jgi:hypothetical protein
MSGDYYLILKSYSLSFINEAKRSASYRANLNDRGRIQA